METNRLDGGDLVVAWLKNAGVRHVFSVSGGPINPIYRACSRQKLPLIHTRHEAAACFMAEASARVTRQPAAAAVTLGPGVTNTVTPAMVATMAGTPLIIVGAQAATRSFERGAGMSYDVLPAMQSVTKWSARVVDVNRIPEYLDVAWRKMWAGRPGPVFLEVPSDILAANADIDITDRAPPPLAAAAGLSESDAEKLKSIFAAAKRPLLLLGDETFWHPAETSRAAIERHGLPFCTIRLARGIVDERHGLWVGPGYVPCNATLRRALAESDCVFLLGHHFEFDLDFGNGLGSATKVVQICSDTALHHFNRRAELAVAASPSAFFDLISGKVSSSVDLDWARGLAAAWAVERDSQLGESEAGHLHPVVAIDAVGKAAADNTIFVSSHGNIDFWADARLKIGSAGRYLRAGQSGALGAEIPYGVGASLADRDASVVVFVGDGGVGYHVTELDTVERYGSALIIVVLDDEMWGAIALPQESRFGETYEMNLPRRDWAGVAKSLGCDGRFCRNTKEIGEAVAHAIASRRPTLIQIPVMSVISPYMKYIS